ncbi:MAG: hypothetical protein K2J40_02755 [Ruminococcus sp.]|nr:hypothetical protein [Ruminococcus sp.]
MFGDFLKFHGIETEIFTEVHTFRNGKVINEKTITHDENSHTTITVNNIGDIYLFYIKLDDTDFELWNDELKNNPRAKSLESTILQNRKIGCLWQVKRTAGQSAIASLFYGFAAMAVAKETDGFIYSDDGAWSYELFPTHWKNLYSEHFDIDSIQNPDIKSTVRKWINLLKRS